MVAKLGDNNTAHTSINRKNLNRLIRCHFIIAGFLLFAKNKFDLKKFSRKNFVGSDNFPE
jgi:hypothetical protein